MLLDTSIVIEFFRGNTIVKARLQKEASLAIPYVVLGELLFGAYRSANAGKHTGQIKRFLANCDILSADAETADQYARIKTTLLQMGKPIPENDIWIAAIATQYNLKLLTRDNHFNHIGGLQLESI
jgi:tRNA(fMet)-specific endonuclease VapC